MLVGKDIYNKIDDIIEHAYLGFLMDVVGDAFFTKEQKDKIESLGIIVGTKPLIELLYILIRNRPTEGYAEDKTLMEILDQVAQTGILPIISDTQQNTLNNSKTAFMETIESTKNQVKKKIKQEVNKTNQDYNQHKVVNRFVPSYQDSKAKEEKSNLLGAAIVGLGASILHDFNRSFTTNMTDSVNNIIADSAVDQAILSNKNPADVIVYKLVISDNSLCPWCKSFYVNEDGSPKEYTLKHLAANGSNMGKPKNEWKPTVTSSHPRCRCQLVIKK